VKREDYISWDDFFMGVALLASQRSKDPHTQVGACIINDKKIIGVGYNGFPNGCSDDEFSWDKPEKYFFIVHSEENAICNCLDKKELINSTMFVTLFPCNECAKIIIQSGIKKIYYLEDKYKDTDSVIASKKMFDAAKVNCEKFIPEKETIEITFK
jgi:dCMP deaminase